ncbi:hypothetical protein DBR32_00955 [Taibaiella sp. KBW10]|uniref:glycosyltransferase family 4 protein n=1 Tax=Taibaiella sp. KBW10 TaxID=2153357 RepID=UPI000F5B1E68|nr:glycosyltransferase family 4 protein [Taibaiella sp. KBW10]RQO32213.1 hypothetical protein DBR32_00955 [Taibaiella sp. KBW10]
MSKILSLVPYKFLPPTSGGHWGILFVEKLLSTYNKVTTVTVAANEVKPGQWPFTLKNVLTNSRSRYIPYWLTRQLRQLSQSERPDYLFCHHHYLFPAVHYVARKQKVPLYIRSHNIESERFRTVGKWWWKLMWHFEKRAYRHADQVFFVTEDDAAWAVAHYGLPKDKAVVMPFLCDFDQVQTTDKDKLAVAREHGLNPDVPWFLFMGVLNYYPNEAAVKVIVEALYPLFKAQLPDFEIIICGKHLNETLQEQIAAIPQIKYLGFVPDLNPILQHSSVMINPVTAGGGVKTKVIESLSWDLTVVSAATGAVGIEKQYCGQKLKIVPDTDWEGFARAAIHAASVEAHIPDAFFEYYYLKNVANRLQKYFV